MLNEYSPANIFGGWLDTRGGGFPGLDVNGGGFSNNIRTRRTLASDWPEIGPVIELVLGHIDIDHDALTWSRLRATSGELMDLVDNLTRIPIEYFAQQVRRWRRCRRNVPQDREYGCNVRMSEKFSAWLECSLCTDGFQGQNTVWKGGTVPHRQFGIGKSIMN